MVVEMTFTNGLPLQPESETEAAPDSSPLVSTKVSMQDVEKEEIIGTEAPLTMNPEVQVHAHCHTDHLRFHSVYDCLGEPRRF